MECSPLGPAQTCHRPRCWELYEMTATLKNTNPQQWLTALP